MGIKGLIEISNETIEISRTKERVSPGDLGNQGSPTDRAHTKIRRNFGERLS